MTNITASIRSVKSLLTLLAVLAPLSAHSATVTYNQTATFCDTAQCVFDIRQPDAKVSINFTYDTSNNSVSNVSSLIFRNNDAPVSLFDSVLPPSGNQGDPFVLSATNTLDVTFVDFALAFNHYYPN